MEEIDFELVEKEKIDFEIMPKEKITFDTENIVIIKPQLEEKEVTPTTETQIIVPDDPNKNLSKVTVNAIPDEYVIPAGTLDIDKDGIYDVKNKESVNVNNAFLGGMIQRSITKVECPNDITSIGKGAFWSWWGLQNVIIPDSVTTFGAHAFQDCPNLILSKLPNSLVTINNHVFSGCTKLAIHTIPASVEIIQWSAFANCGGIKELTFKGTPTTIHSSALNGCSNIKIINVPWSEGEVANAPWGATNATINYNYIENK